MMQPSEQSFQEKASQQGYGMYTGVEQPSINQAYEQEPNNFAGNWVREEGIPGAHRQQQFYAQQEFSHSMHLVPKGHFVAILSYTLGWFSALIFLFFGWQNRFIRFHALQSLFFFGAVNILDGVLLRGLFFLRGMHSWSLPVLLCAFLLVNSIAAIAWVLGMVQAGLGNYYKLPICGNWIMRKFLAPDAVK